MEKIWKEDFKVNASMFSWSKRERCNIQAKVSGSQQQPKCFDGPDLGYRKLITQDI